MHCTIYDCINIDKQSLYSLALMPQVKVFNTLGDYRVVTSSLYAVRLARLMKLDTLLYLLYYELLFYCTVLLISNFTLAIAQLNIAQGRLW